MGKEEGAMELYQIVLCAICACAAVSAAAFAACVFFSRRRRARAQRAVNGRALRAFLREGFFPARAVSLPDRAACHRGEECAQKLFFDENFTKFAVIDYGEGIWQIAEGRDLVDYEVIKDGAVIASGSMFGGFAAGPYAIGPTHVCKELSLIVIFKGGRTAYRLIGGGFLVSTRSALFRRCCAGLEEAVSLLEETLRASDPMGAFHPMFPFRPALSN